MDDKLGNVNEWGPFRFSVIGKLLVSPPVNRTLYKELEKLSKEKFLHPKTGEWTSFGFSTIEKWYYMALSSTDPVSALSRRNRRDFGETRMNLLLGEALRQQYRQHSTWSYQLHHDNLAALTKEKEELGPLVSYSAMRRWMKARGLYRKKKGRGRIREHEAPHETKEIRSYEVTYVNGLWHTDFHHGRLRVVDDRGVFSTPIAVCFLDDCSRLGCHLQWYLDETASSFIHGMSQAFAKRGLPRAILSDNGSAMRAEETREGLSRLSIVQDFTLPYSPYQNAKIECFWAQVEGRLMAQLEGVKNLTLAFLNEVTQAWLELEYNRKPHSELGEECPINRYITGEDVSRPAPSMEELQMAFTVKETRTQRFSDGTLTISGVRFEVPSWFNKIKKLSVRYRSWDLSKAWIIDNRTGTALASIYPLDKARNADGQRRVIARSDVEVEEENNIEESGLPPYLKHILAQYARTGLPPAYIPKEAEPGERDEEGNDHE